MDLNNETPEKAAIIGVDVGGTKISAGAITPEGEILCGPETIPTKGKEGKEIIYGRISGSIERIIDKLEVSRANILGIGLGVTGPIDIETGTILECPQLPTMNYYPLKEKLGRDFQLPVFMNNDANAMILGESIWGAGKGNNIVLGYTLGTGLGCALVVNNRLFTGTNGLAGEIWLSPYENGTIEEIISGDGISSIYFRLTNQDKTAKEISSLAYNGDKDAIETWNIFGRTLAGAIAWGINMIDPGIVIVGGSIANSMDLFDNSMNDFLKEHICPVPAGKTRVVKASFGDLAGFMGAAALVI